MAKRRTLLAAGALAPFGAALAQDRYPSRPVTVINPFAAGGQSDPIGRLVNAHLQRTLGQPFVLDNKLGAGSTVGGQYVARAEADGHTLLLGTTSTFVITPYVYRPQPYDPVAAFAPVAVLTESPMVLVANPKKGFRAVADVLRAARERPGEVSVASAGNGSLPHLHAELFASLAGLRLNHVPYRGGAPAMNDVVAGQVDLFFEVVSTTAPHAKAGRVVPLLVTAQNRSPLVPEVPTAAELGYPDLSLTSWTGLAAPVGTPAAVIGALTREVNISLRSDEMAAFVSRLGISTVGGDPARMAERIAREGGLYRRIIETTGISSS